MKACQTLRSQSPYAFRYLELISDERGDRTSIIAMVALSVNHYSTRTEIFDKFVMFVMAKCMHSWNSI